MSDSELEWSSDIGYDSDKNSFDPFGYGFDDSPMLWEAGSILCQIERKQVRISGKPKMVAARGAYIPGFLGLWIYSKDGESGTFSISKQSERMTKSLIEHVFANWDHKRKLDFKIDHPPLGPTPAVEFLVKLEIDEPIVANCESQGERKESNEENIGDKDNNSRGHSQKMIKSVKVLFHWEPSREPIPSKAFQD
jgi:hypothetical protein